ncbi:MAG: host attachment protein [Hyphomicrobium sp.]|uniref:baeRF12 domain-containing protein n=1 Tax=Hyphomicrobium sp. TaxID=82 RepID=UPI0039E240B2
MKPTSTWILIADGSGARILEALGQGRGFREHAIGSGVRHEPSGPETAPPHQPVEGRPGAKRALQALFARQLSTMLAGYLRNNAFDRLILIAPAPLLDELRKMISPAVREKVVVEIEKDMTDIPTSDLSLYLDEVAAS